MSLGFAPLPIIADLDQRPVVSAAWRPVMRWSWTPVDAVEMAVLATFSAMVDPGTTGDIRLRIAESGAVTPPIPLAGLIESTRMPWLEADFGMTIANDGVTSVVLEARRTLGSGGVTVREAAATVAPATLSDRRAGNLLSADSAEFEPTVGGWTAINATWESSVQTVPLSAEAVGQLTAMADGDMVLALTEEAVPVRIDELLTFLIRTKHAGNPSIVDIGVRYLDPQTGVQIGDDVWVASGTEGSGEGEAPGEEPPVSVFVERRINAGSFAAESNGSATFTADAFYTGGNTVTITDPALSALPAAYKNARWGMTSYRLPAASRALIRWHMVEDRFTAPGKRVFSLGVGEGASFGYAAVNLDLFATVGRGVVHTVEAVVEPQGGFINLTFPASADNGIVSAIEVLDGAALPLTPLTYPGAEPDFTARIVLPLAGSTVTADPITLVADTIPTKSGSVASVAFYKGAGTRTLLQSTSTVGAYGWAIDVSRADLGTGTVVVSADVTDTQGNVTQTADVTFTTATGDGGVIVVDPNGVQAYMADAFTDSIGICTHLGRSGVYTSGTRYEDIILDIGFRKVRGSNTSSASIAKIKKIADANPDVEWMWWVPRGADPAPIRSTIKSINSQVGRKVITMVEGPNEPDSSMVGDGGAEIRAHAKQIWDTMRADPETAHLQIYTASLARVGSNESYVRLGDQRDRAHKMNNHNYPGGRMMSDSYLDQIESWSGIVMGADPTNGRNPMTTKVMASELGYSSAVPPQDSGDIFKHPPVGDPDARAVLTLRIYLEHWRRGINPTFFYEMISQGSDVNQWEMQFGMVRNDFVYTETAHAMKAMIAITADPGPAFTPGKLAYQIQGANADTRHFLTQKRDGSFWLAIWQQTEVWDRYKTGWQTSATVSSMVLNPPDVPVTVRLGRTATFTQYRPNSATRANPIGAAVSNVDNVAVTSSERVTFVRIMPG